MNLCKTISVQWHQQGLKGKTEFAAGWLLGTVTLLMAVTLDRFLMDIP